MNRLVIILIFTLACVTHGCGGRAIETAADAAPGSFADGGSDTGVLADAGGARCGDGTCSAGEDCLGCHEDCDCTCGDGVCTFGEFCAVCPQDCDCATLAATPPMGWNSWNRFHCQIDEQMIREVADAMVSSGLKAAGYTYLNLDDCWQASRAADGTIEADPGRFASGIPALAEYVHGKGLKFGLYTCAGTLTCQGKPGSYGYEAQDAATYAAWGVDYIKVDWCHTEGMDPRTRYAAMRDGLASAGRPVVFSICNWGVDQPWVWGPATGQLWRTTGDIWDNYDSMLGNFDTTSGLAAFASAGHWNDPDMLEVGNGLMTREEYRTHMSLWAIIAAPLIAGNDIRAMSEVTRDMLTNPEVIAVDQDPAGLQGVKVAGGDKVEAWAKPVTRYGTRAVVLLNRASVKKDITVKWSDIGLAPGEALVRDLWKKADAGEFDDSYTSDVAAHGVEMITVVGMEPAIPPGEVYLSDVAWKYAANSLGPVEKDTSNGGAGAGDGGAITIGGTVYAKGLGAGAASVIVWHLGGSCSTFSADIGVDDAAAGAGTVTFEVWADGTKLFDSGKVTGGTAAQSVNVSVEGKRELKLVVTPAGDTTDGDMADWAGARLKCK